MPIFKFRSNHVAMFFLVPHLEWSESCSRVNIEICVSDARKQEPSYSQGQQGYFYSVKGEQQVNKWFPTQPCDECELMSRVVARTVCGRGYLEKASSSPSVSIALRFLTQSLSGLAFASSVATYSSDRNGNSVSNCLLKLRMGSFGPVIIHNQIAL